MILFLSMVTFTIPSKAATSSHIVNPMQVYSYAKMVSDIKKLKSAFPDLVNVKVIGKSEYGRSIYAISVGKGPANLLINGSHHAREWLTTNLNMYMADRYAEAYIKKQKINGYDARSILTSSTIWFVPMVNPDGVTLQQQGPGAFPKSVRASLIKMNDGSMNFKRWKANAKGIDLNRQYPASWNNLHGPNHPSYANYKGKAPETAAETKALLKFVDQINPEMVVSYHSAGKILYWNYKQDQKRYARYYVYAKKIHQMTGYSLVYIGPHPTGGGGFTDWYVSVKKRPAFTPEIANPIYESNPPLSNFPKAWQENQAVGLYIAQEGTKLYQARLLSTLQAKYKTLQTQANKLQTYDYTNIKTEGSLKIDQNFTNLFESFSSDRANGAVAPNQ